MDSKRIHGSFSEHYKCPAKLTVPLCAECLAVFVNTFCEDDTIEMFAAFFGLDGRIGIGISGFGPFLHIVADGEQLEQGNTT